VITNRQLFEPPSILGLAENEVVTPHFIAVSHGWQTASAFSPSKRRVIWAKSY
jgi:hypothetical protein